MLYGSPAVGPAFDRVDVTYKAGLPRHSRGFAKRGNHERLHQDFACAGSAEEAIGVRR